MPLLWLMPSSLSPHAAWQAVIQRLHEEMVRVAARSPLFRHECRVDVDAVEWPQLADGVLKHLALHRLPPPLVRDPWNHHMTVGLFLARTLDEPDEAAHLPLQLLNRAKAIRDQDRRTAVLGILREWAHRVMPPDLQGREPQNLRTLVQIIHASPLAAGVGGGESSTGSDSSEEGEEEGEPGPEDWSSASS